MSSEHSELIREYIQTSIATHQQLLQTSVDILGQIADLFIEAMHQGGTVYLCGNGGSAADAQHIAAEFVGRFLRERRALPAQALTTNTSILTAIGNDYAFEEIFARQVQALVKPEDIVVGISTSGNSKNILRAIQAATEIGAATVAFTGSKGQQLGQRATLCFYAPSDHTPQIQEAQLTAWHIICDLVERSFSDDAQ